MSSTRPSAGPASRRLLVAIGMVGAPLCLSLGNLIGPPVSRSAAATLATAHAQTGLYLTAAVLEAAGFALFGAVGVGIAMLVRRRAAALATVAAVLSLVGGVVMGGAVLTTAFVTASLPGSDAAVLGTLQSSPTLGALFGFALLTGLAGVLGTIALLVARPVRTWIPILLLVGLVLSFLGGGPLGALLTVPAIVALALLAGALVKRDGARAEVPAAREAALA